MFTVTSHLPNPLSQQVAMVEDFFFVAAIFHLVVALCLDFMLVDFAMVQW